MKRALSVVLLLSLTSAAALAGDSFSPVKLRIADAASDACLANCATQNASCQRVCPTTLATPCINNCQVQAQTCRENCQRR